jgi:hypothetical protein
MKLLTSALGNILSVCLLAHAGAALAQQASAVPGSATGDTPAKGTPAKDAPPKLERIEEGSDVPITVTPPKSGGTRVTEKREGGRIVESKVKAGGSEYTLRPNSPAGNAQPGDAVSNNTRPPTWTVLEFDLNKKKNSDMEATAEAAAVPPPPPPAGTK